jgi:hypothetical protein
MPQAHDDLGQRIVRAARLAVALHQLADAQDRVVALERLEAQEREEFADDGWRSPTAESRLGWVTDDTPSTAIPLRTPWTRTGEDPARSFFN